jgi:hypothetical protein
MTFTRADAKRIWAEVQANHDKLRGCPCHRFRGGAPAIGKKMVCFNCKGEIGLPEIGTYIAGYIAAGGDAADVWPEYASGLKAEAALSQQPQN